MAIRSQHLPIRCRGAASAFVLAILTASGCVGGRWIESPTDAQLPLERPARGYPTAIQDSSKPGPIRASLSDDPPTTVIPASPEVAAAQPNVREAPPHVAAVAPANRPTESRERPAPPVANLAVLPAHLRAPAAAHLPASEAGTDAASPSAPEVLQVAAPLANEPTTVPAIAAAVSQSPMTGSSSAPQHLPATEKLTELSPATSIHESNAPPDRQARMDDAYRELVLALEAEIRERRAANAGDEELPRLEQNLRLAYLAAGRLDDAASVVLSLDEAQREAYKQLMFSLGVWLSPDEARRAPLRTAKVLQSLREATTELASASKLEIRKLAFCERVDYFGWFSEFPKNEFQAKQQVILYVEVDNFSAEKKSPTAFETELQASYQIFDSGGQVIAERKLPLDKEICRNYRRDYFLAYRMYMPEAIAAGRYRLELTVEDLKAQGKFQGRKFGEGMIEFTVRQ
jgi:hypothetical protein